MLRFKINGFQLDDHVAVEPCVVEEEVYEKLLFPHLYPDLSPYIGKTRTEFQKELGDMA